MSFIETYLPTALVAHGVVPKLLQRFYAKTELIGEEDTRSLAQIFELLEEDDLSRLDEIADRVVQLSRLVRVTIPGVSQGIALCSRATDEAGHSFMAVLRKLDNHVDGPTVELEAGWGVAGLAWRPVPWTTMFSLLPHLGLAVPESPALLRRGGRNGASRVTYCRLPGPDSLRIAIRCFRER